MALPNLATVRLVTDRHGDQGVSAGDVGTVLEDWGDGNYDVDVSNPEAGETIAWSTAAEKDLMLLDVPHPKEPTPAEE